MMPCDVEDIASVDAVFDEIKKQWGTMDFLVHAVAFSDKNELKGRYADSTRENFIRTMVISCYAFTEAAKRAAALMPNGGAMVTLTYNGGLRAMPNYNVMGVAKAGLEASVRYLAVDFGPQKIRVNAISAGPIRTLAGAGITDARYMFAFQQKYSPLGRGVTLEELGGAGLYLLSDLSTGVTGEVHFVDSGYNVIAMPQPDALKAALAGRGRATAGSNPSPASGHPAANGTTSTIGNGRRMGSPSRQRIQRRPGLIPGRLVSLQSFGCPRDQARSKRSAFITLVHAATKSFTNFSFESAHA